MEKIVKELKLIGLLGLYFGSWLAGMMLIKYLILAEYHIKLSDVSMVLVGALVLSKVVLILDHVSLGNWVKNQPAWIDVILRTLFYMAGVLIVLLLEKSFEGRHEYHGFLNALQSIFEHADIYHVWLNFICISGALLFYNVLSVIYKNLGTKAIMKMFTSPIPTEESQ